MTRSTAPNNVAVGVGRYGGAGSATDQELVADALARNDAAWREIVRRHTAALRELARETNKDLSVADVEDLMSELWVSLLENDMRRLRSFDPASGYSLLSWISIRFSQRIFAWAEQRISEPAVDPIANARNIAAPAPEQICERPFLSVDELAKRWDLDRKTVYAMIQRGELSVRRCGRLVRIPRVAVLSFESQACVVLEKRK